MDNNTNSSENYLRFFAMIGTAMIAMFFLMYTNSYQVLDHAWFSEERLFMTLIMGGSMMIIMLAFMLQMYKSSKMNIAIFIGGALLLVGSIWLSRSQATIDDVDYMEGMIPHHSIAILTSERNHAAMEDSAAVVQVLDSFRTAIIDNDQEKAWVLLTKDARILESGGIETKKEYLSRHFHSDGKFLSMIEREVKSQKVKSNEHTAWVSTVSYMHGNYNDQDISINSAELAVLVKTEQGWKISSVHWSSRSTG